MKSTPLRLTITFDGEILYEYGKEKKPILKPKILSLLLVKIFDVALLKFFVRGRINMKFLASVEISKGFDSWIEVNKKLGPRIEEHGLKFHQAISNFEETKVFMLIENSDPEKSMAFLSRDDVLQDRLDAGVVETQQIISDIENLGQRFFRGYEIACDSRD